MSRPPMYDNAEDMQEKIDDYFVEKKIKAIKKSKEPVTLLHHDLVDAVGGGVAMGEITKITRAIDQTHDVKYCAKKGEWTFIIKKGECDVVQVPEM